MRARLLLFLLIFAGAGLGVYLLIKTAAPPADQSLAPTPGEPPAVAAANPMTRPPPSPVAPVPPPPLANKETEDAVAAPAPPQPLSATAAQSIPAPSPYGLPPATVLANMRSTIRQYGALFGGNPVGTNPEITKALNGDNPRHINFLKDDGNRVNEQGELVDPWGTPYFFHQLSAKDMEVRSAGPDKTMWTGDDLVTR